MKLSISNIAWNENYDKEMYEYIANNGFNGIEIAPTRIIKENPYFHIEEAENFANQLKKRYNLEIPSMQSIWYGRSEKIFANKEERREMLEYTKKAIDFASKIKCNNMVFGCPNNRNINSLEKDYEVAINFFNQIGNYAKNKNVYFSIEPNPTIYNTNFINTTIEAIKLVKDINNSVVKVNIDFGTIIQNNEDINILKDNIELINHVHISEPNLEPIRKRSVHNKLIEILKVGNYQGYISIEMKNINDIQKVKEIMKYVRDMI